MKLAMVDSLKSLSDKAFRWSTETVFEMASELIVLNNLVAAFTHTLALMANQFVV